LAKQISEIFRQPKIWEQMSIPLFPLIQLVCPQQQVELGRLAYGTAVREVNGAWPNHARQTRREAERRRWRILRPQHRYRGTFSAGVLLLPLPLLLPSLNPVRHLSLSLSLSLSLGLSGVSSDLKPCSYT